MWKFSIYTGLTIIIIIFDLLSKIIKEKYVIFFKDESNKTFSLATHATNPDTIEENFAAITLLASLSDTQVKTTSFYVRSTDPSSSITLKVCIAFALF